MIRTVLKQYYCERILEDAELVGKIAKATLKSPESVKRWAKQNHEMLLLTTCIDQIRSHLKLSKSEILTETVDDSEESGVREITKDRGVVEEVK